MIGPQVGLDGADVAVELLEEFVGEGLFVEGLVADAKEVESANGRPPTEVEFGEALRRGAIAFARANTEASENEALAGLVAGRRAAHFGVDDVNASAAFGAERGGVRKEEQGGRKAFAELEDQGALGGTAERPEFAVNDGEPTAGNVAMPGKDREVLIGGEPGRVALAPGFLVAAGKGVAHVFKAEQRAEQLGEVVPGAEGGLEEGFEPEFQFVVAVGRHVVKSEGRNPRAEGRGDAGWVGCKRSWPGGSSLDTIGYGVLFYVEADFGYGRLRRGRGRV